MSQLQQLQITTVYVKRVPLLSMVFKRVGVGPRDGASPLKKLIPRKENHVGTHGLTQQRRPGKKATATQWDFGTDTRNVREMDT